ncbi:DUF6415 family natural product biosynthesis protein [Streptomyces sp. 8N114]|uniref:DUF6415 family natural product biosynthesis protein n=1 Tax=Streptomyces sp. 8N114 TaxID=3457419 RepID=UPI003FD2AF9C
MTQPTHHVLYDPDGLITGNLPLDRGPHEALVDAVLALTEPETSLPPRDYEQIALQLTGAARAVAADVERRSVTLPEGDERRTAAEETLTAAERLLSHRSRGTLQCAKDRARLVKSLYDRLDHLEGVAAADPAT